MEETGDVGASGGQRCLGIDTPTSTAGDPVLSNRVMPTTSSESRRASRRMTELRS